MSKVRLDAGAMTSDRYRLLVADKSWAGRLLPSGDAAALTAADGRATSSMRLVMKGTARLIACDEQHSFSVRRVEHSNTLLLVRHSGMVAGAAETAGAVPHKRAREECAADAGERCAADGVVLAALTRSFELQQTQPRRNALHVLQTTVPYLTLDELQTGGHGGEVGTPAFSPATASYMTFQDLACLAHSSPRELAEHLCAHGAIVHRGFVRLLHPELLHEALHSVLSYAEATTEARPTSWDDVARHLCPSVYPAVVLHVVRRVYGAVQREDDVMVDADVTVVPRGVAHDGLIDVAAALVGLAGRVFDTHPRVVWRTLRGGSRAASLDAGEFYDAWRNLVPPSWQTSWSTTRAGVQLRLLHGYVICATVQPGSLVNAVAWWLPRHTLSDEPAERIALLFEIHDTRWDDAAFRAYVEPLVREPFEKFDQVVCRYAKEYRVPGEPVQYGRI